MTDLFYVFLSFWGCVGCDKLLSLSLNESYIVSINENGFFFFLIWRLYLYGLMLTIYICVFCNIWDNLIVKVEEWRRQNHNDHFLKITQARFKRMSNELSIYIRLVIWLFEQVSVWMSIQLSVWGILRLTRCLRLELMVTNN